VQKEWTHEQEAASLNDALNLGYSSFPSIDGRGVETSLSMRTGQHPQGTVVRPAIIEVHSLSQHSFENANRGLHVHHPFFLRPSRKALRGPALADGDHQILMPSDLPVHLGSLVEQDRLDGKATWSKNCFHRPPNCRGMCDFVNGQVILKQVPEAGLSQLALSMCEVRRLHPTRWHRRRSQIRRARWTRRCRTPRRVSSQHNRCRLRTCRRFYTVWRPAVPRKCYKAVKN
jgi:hypothetical protein